MANDAAAKFSEEYEKQLLDALKGSHEQYDKAILTLSSGGLALSITLLKDVFPVDKIVLPGLLAASWYLFCAAIISTLFSFLTSIKAVNTQRDYFHKYIIEGILEYKDKRNWWTIGTKWLNRISAICFVSGVIATVYFADGNFKEKLKKPTTNVNVGAASAIQKPVSSATRLAPVTKKKKRSTSVKSSYRITINGSGKVIVDIPPMGSQKIVESAPAVPDEVVKPQNEHP